MTKTITTAEELDALPVGTIIRAHWTDGSLPDHFVVRIGGARMMPETREQIIE